MKIQDVILLLLGLFLTGWGLLLSAGGIINISNGQESLAGGIALVTFLGILPLAGGGWLIKIATEGKRRRRLARQAPPPTKEMMERKILQLAAASACKLTPSEVALKTQMTLEKATNILNNMQEMGHAELQVSQNGAVVYYFHGLLSQDDKEDTRGLLP